jgi:hypothetical protein
MAAESAGLLTGLRQQVEALPPSSRRLLLVLLVLLGFVWMLGLWWYTSGDIAAREADLQSRQRNLRNLQTLQLQVGQAEAKIAEAEQRLGGSRQNPSSFIESTVNEIGARDSLRGIEKLGSETKGSLKQTRYRVSLQRGTLDHTMKLIHDIERAGFMMVESTQFKTTTVNNEKFLNTTIDLVAYEVVKEGE